MIGSTIGWVKVPSSRNAWPALENSIRKLRKRLPPVRRLTLESEGYGVFRCSGNQIRKPPVPVDQKGLVGVGRITGLFGVQGWVRIFSYTEPRENILSFQPIYVGRHDTWEEMRLIEGRRHGKGVVAKLENIDNRDHAAALMGSEISVRREQFPEIASGQYYWADLEGLRVITSDGVELGTVDHLLATGANDVLVIKGEQEHLVPFLPDDVVLEINLAQGWIRVEWDPDF